MDLHSINAVKASGYFDTQIWMALDQIGPVVLFYYLTCVHLGKNNCRFLEILDRMQVGKNYQKDGVVDTDVGTQVKDALVTQVFDVVFVGCYVEWMGNLFCQRRLCPAEVDEVE